MHKLPIIAAAAAVLISGCTQSPQPSQGVQADERLQALLAGKVAGPPVGCIPAYESSRAPSLIARGSVAFTVNPGLVYVTNVAGTGCEDVADPTYTLVSKSPGGMGLCSGDTLEVRDTHTGTFRGACTVGQLVPYRMVH
jgi:hypothetical protein